MQMLKYIGTKIIMAKPMSRLDYNNYRGWELPADENGDDMGYLVEYVDGGQSNHACHVSYISWSPADVFNNAYQPMTNMSFSHALEFINRGYKMQRAGWNGKGMFVFLVPGSTFKVNRPPLLGIYPEGTEINYHAHIDMKTADGTIVPWLCSQTDVLAKDWQLVEDCPF